MLGRNAALLYGLIKGGSIITVRCRSASFIIELFLLGVTLGDKGLKASIKGC
ncbi:MAG TPA: hypothetical protein VG519_02710 [Pseudochrobactrum sp.]|nr:hypothetical protein [Pseudochrobactrum sp.]